MILFYKFSHSLLLSLFKRTRVVVVVVVVGGFSPGTILTLEEKKFDFKNKSAKSS